MFAINASSDTYSCTFYEYDKVIAGRIIHHLKNTGWIVTVIYEG